MIKRDLNTYFAGKDDESTIRRLRSDIEYWRYRKQMFEEMRDKGYKCHDKVTDNVIDWEDVISDYNNKLNKAEQEYKEILIRLKKSQINKEFEDD